MELFTTNFVQRLYFIVLQRSSALEMADKLRENGKIYVVVAILVAILLGVLFYLISIDKKISKLEKNNNQ